MDERHRWDRLAEPPRWDRPGETELVGRGRRRERTLHPLVLHHRLLLRPHVHLLHLLRERRYRVAWQEQLSRLSTERVLSAS